MIELYGSREQITNAIEAAGGEIDAAGHPGSEVCGAH